MSDPRKPGDARLQAVRARVGCSGWLYEDWRGRFYPSGLPQRDWLPYYATKFDTVELNGTFYRLPDASRFDGWRTSVPAEFVFAVKASRYLTHMKRLTDPAEPLDRLLGRARRLRGMLGPLLYQLPTGWKADLPRLEQFLRALPKRRRHVLEFRDPSWYTDEVYARLERFHVALCLHDMEGSATPRQIVGPITYVRFHGIPKYAGRYDQRVLDGWADWLAPQMRDGRPIFAYFNNTIGGQAAEDAIRLRHALAARSAVR